MASDGINAAAAGTWTLGDRAVNRLGFGSMRITANPDWELALRVLRRAVELGVNHIDTAAFYFSLGGILGVGSGPVRYATELIRDALRPYPDDLVIVTKVGPGVDPVTGEFHQATIAGAKRESGATAEHSAALHAVARAHDATPAQVRLAWTLHRGPHVLAIPGTGDPEHLVENVAAGALRLSPAELASLG